jgi:hypothetical protein
MRITSWMKTKNSPRYLIQQSFSSAQHPWPDYSSQQQPQFAHLPAGSTDIRLSNNTLHFPKAKCDLFVLTTSECNHKKTLTAGKEGLGKGFLGDVVNGMCEGDVEEARGGVRDERRIGEWDRRVMMRRRRWKRKGGTGEGGGKDQRKKKGMRSAYM